MAIGRLDHFSFRLGANEKAAPAWIAAAAAAGSRTVPAPINAFPFMESAKASMVS